jgi:hypothetical protein
VNVVLVLLGALVLALGLVSARISQSPFPPSLPAFGASIAIGPHVLGWVDNAELGSRPRMVEVAARITLGIGMVGAARRVPVWTAMSPLPSRKRHEQPGPLRSDHETGRVVMTRPADKCWPGICNGFNWLARACRPLEVRAVRRIFPTPTYWRRA